MGRLGMATGQLFSIAAIGLAWETLSGLRILDPLFIPAPSAVWGAFGRVLPEALPRFGETSLRTLCAYGLATGMGIGSGLIVGSQPVLRRVAMPYVLALYSVPKILIVPWIVLVLGISFNAALLSGTLFAVFPIMLLTAGGIRDVDPILLRAAVSMGASPWRLYRSVLLPASIPAILTGMRIGIVFALLGVLLAEMFAGIGGMGFLMKRLALAFKASDLFATTAVVSAISIIMVLLLDHLTHRLGRWR